MSKARLVSLVILAVVLMVSLLGVSCSGTDKDEVVNIRLACHMPASHPIVEWQIAWEEAITERTGGAITFENYPGQALLKTSELITGVSEGIADMSIVLTQYCPSQAPLWSVCEIPYVTIDPYAAMKSWEALYDNRSDIQAEFEANNIIPLTWNATEPTLLWTSKPVRTLEDLQGMKIRATGYFVKIMENLGATGIAIGGGDTYEAASRGVIDGATCINMRYGCSIHIYEACPYVCDPGMGVYTAEAAVINKDVWDRISPENQQIIRDISAEFMDTLIAGLNDAGKSYAAELAESEAEPIVLSDSEIARWKDLNVGIHQEWKDSHAQYGDSTGIYDYYVASCAKFEPQSIYEDPFPLWVELTK